MDQGFGISRVGSGWVELGRVGSARLGSARLGLVCEALISRVGSGHSDSIRPGISDPTREKL